MKKKLKVYTVTFGGYYLMGEALVVAEDEKEAKKMMQQELIDKSLDPKDIYSITEVTNNKKEVIVLCDGDY